MSEPHYLQRSIGSLPPRFAEAFDEVSFWSSRFGALLFEHLEPRAGVRGLDVGCATGFPLFELAQSHGPSSRFIGIDIWKDALDQARLKRHLRGFQNVDLVHADGTNLPFATSTFDLITSNLGINNFDRPDAVFAECFRVARPGCRVVLTTNLSGHMSEVYDLFRGVLREMGRTDLIEPLDAQEAHRGTRVSVEEVVSNAGFRLLRSIESEFFLRFADGSAMFRHGLVRFFLDGWRPVFAGADEALIFEKSEARLNQMAASGGGLKFRIPMLYVEGGRG